MAGMETTPHSGADAPDPSSPSGVSIRVARRDELPAVLAVQREGFTRIAERGGFPPTELPPVRETLEELEALYDVGVRTLVGVADDRVVGTVRGLLRDDGSVEVGRLAVDGDHLRRGIASALMSALEGEFPSASRFELFTGSEQMEALALYARLGYRIYGREEYEHWTLVRLEKIATRVGAPRLH